ncbi:hypothetical protein [Halonatronum saccharophilum]|uniref:hypothetical protein n=1 Tax=Halonatronum saccharophilum TaxID=150060 RepID=UPI000483190F|nr:hypothetical protein [Halonatronum saccharophilum]
MKKIYFLIILSLLLLFFPSKLEASGEKVISTLGSSNLISQTNMTKIHLNINGDGRNRSQIQQEVRRSINDLLEELLSLEAFKEEDIEDKGFSWSDNTKLKERNVYKYAGELVIEIIDNDPDSLYDTTLEVLDLIKELDPSQRRVNYNRHVNIEYNINEAYYSFSNVKKYKETLLKNSLEDSRETLDILLNLSSLNFVGIAAIEEVKGSNLNSYVEEIDLDDIQQPKLKVLESKILVDYRVK